MTVILIREELDDDEIAQLHTEFPFLDFHVADPQDPLGVSDELWARAEVLYCHRLSSEELAKAVRLGWIHVPSPYLDQLPMTEVNRRRDLLVSETLEEHSDDAALYALSAMLAFAKKLFAWREATRSGTSLAQSAMAEESWSLERLTLLQIGLGAIGSRIAARARDVGIRVVGVREHASFHPACHRVLSHDQLRAALPSADIVALSTGREGGFRCRLGKEELQLMRNGSALVVIGTASNIDLHALAEVGHNGKFRGIALDLYFPEEQPPPDAPLWKLPNLILTPAIAAYPPLDEHDAFRLFRYNLRQFAHENYRDMKNVVRRKG
jgi:D-2-hydroxyacid dehydrogenase (NADP+)